MLTRYDSLPAGEIMADPTIALRKYDMRARLNDLYYAFDLAVDMIDALTYYKAGTRPSSHLKSSISQRINTVVDRLYYADVIDQETRDWLRSRLRKWKGNVKIGRKGYALYEMLDIIEKGLAGLVEEIRELKEYVRREFVEPYADRVLAEEL